MFANANPALIRTIELGLVPLEDFLALPGEVNFMLDIETLAASSDAAITEIGCVRMDSGKTFHCHVIDNYGSRDPITIVWRTVNNLPWKNVASVDENCYSLYDGLSMFFDWLQLEAADQKIVMWCKGTDFDKVITAAAAKSVDLKVPWKYNEFFDMRTLLKLFPEFKIPKEQVTHSALEDAILQTGQLLKIAHNLNEIKRDAGL